MNGNRTYLGRSKSASLRHSVYLTEDGFDIDSREQYDVVQRRVLFDDVQYVTLHRELGVAYLATTGIISLIFGTAALTIYMFNPDVWQVALGVALPGIPFLIAFLLRLIFGLEVITIFGRRSKGRIHFALRKERAREMYARVCGVVAEAQGLSH